MISYKLNKQKNALQLSLSRYIRSEITKRDLKDFYITSQDKSSQVKSKPSCQLVFSFLLLCVFLFCFVLFCFHFVLFLFFRLMHICHNVIYVGLLIPYFRLRDNSVHLHECSPFWIGILTAFKEENDHVFCFM